MKKNFFNSILFLFIFLICFSCASTKDVSISTDKKEYTTEDFIQNKILEIEKNISSDTVNTMSLLLFDSIKE